MEKLSEKQAWAVAKIVFQFRTGLCRTINQLVRDGLITNETERTMRARLRRFGRRRGLSTTGYYFTCREAATDDSRVALVERLLRAAKRAR